MMMLRNIVLSLNHSIRKTWLGNSIGRMKLECQEDRKLNKWRFSKDSLSISREIVKEIRIARDRKKNRVPDLERKNTKVKNRKRTRSEDQDPPQALHHLKSTKIRKNLIKKISIKDKDD
jgi:hypothetical protein